MTTITTNAYTKVIKDWTTASGLRAVILLVRGSHHCGYVYSEGIWRDVDYCTNECESLANQLVNIKLLN